MRTAWQIGLVVLACLGNAGSTAHAQQADRRDRKDPELVVESGGRMGTCDVLTFTADGKHLLAAGDDKVVRVWSYQDGRLDPRSMKVLRWPIWREQRGSIYALSPDREGRRVAVGGLGLRASNAAVAVLDRVSGKVVQMGRPPASRQENFYAVRSIAFAPSGKEVVYGTSDGSIWRWDLESRRTTRIGRHEPPAGKRINRILLLHFLEPMRLLTLAEDGGLREWDLKADPPAGKRLTLLGKTKDLFRAVVSPDGKWLAAAALGPVVYVRSLDGKQTRDIDLPQGQFPRSIAFDGRGRLAVGVGALAAKTAFYIETDNRIRFHDLTKTPATVSEGPPTPTAPTSSRSTRNGATAWSWRAGTITKWSSGTCATPAGP